jgi:hypothetical protein
MTPEQEQRNVSTIAGLIVEIRKLNIAKGWRVHFPEGEPAPRTGPWFAAYCGLAHTEVSEALDAYRDKIWSDTMEVKTRKYGGKAIVSQTEKPIGVGPELADALIRLLDMVDIWEVDIEYELARVLTYGWTRPYQHGGRVL